MNSPAWKNKLFFGDNLKTLREEIDDESVDLIYLDPPFNSNATYNVLFEEKSGERSAAQIAVFEDTWHWGQEAELAYFETVQRGGKLGDLLQAFRTFLGQNDMMAYLVMMAPRIAELHRVMKQTGSLYLHCDPTACHYLKLLLDAVYGPDKFLNEAIWKRTSAHSGARRYGPVHDVLFFYSKSESFTWNRQYTDHDERYLTSHYRNSTPDGRRYTLSDLTASGVRHGFSGKPWRGFDPNSKGNHWKFKIESLDRLDEAGRIYWPKAGGWPRYVRYLDEVKGLPMQDVWTDLSPINAKAQERLGYPTQKPESLLERIILASSNEGDVILDPFCGCGTAISVAERLNRRWIGIDITHLAIALIRHRLHFAFDRQLGPYEVHGDPKDLESAHALAQLDRYQFEWWAVGLADARPSHDRKKGADGGIDGHIPFFVDNSGKTKKAVVQVKSGHVTRSHIGDLNNARIRERAEVGVFITLERPTKQMMTEAASAGFYEVDYFEPVARIQILTIADLLTGKKPKLPALAILDLYKKPPVRQKGKQPAQADLFKRA